MKGISTSDKQIKYITDLQKKLGQQINIPKRSKEAGKKIKKLLLKIKNNE